MSGQPTKSLSMLMVVVTGTGQGAGRSGDIKEEGII
jgi:hypothetical protein